MKIRAEQSLAIRHDRIGELSERITESLIATKRGIPCCREELNRVVVCGVGRAIEMGVRSERVLYMYATIEATFGQDFLDRRENLWMRAWMRNASVAPEPKVETLFVALIELGYIG